MLFFCMQGAAMMFEAIWKHLTEVLIKDPPSLSKRQVELGQHSAFLTSRCGLYLGEEEHITILDRNLHEGVFVYACV